MVNKVTLIGRLGKDPETKYTPDGTMVVNFSLATGEVYKNKNGEKVARTDWHRIVVWGRLAEICGNYLTKGKLIYAEGKLQTRSWEDQNGNKHSVTEIVLLNMHMLEPRGGNGASDDGRGPDGDYPVTADGIPVDDDPPF